MTDPSLDVDMLVIAGVGALLSFGAWFSSSRSRREQAKLKREQIEEEAFSRIQTMYTEALKVGEEQLRIANARIAEQNRRIHDLEQYFDHSDQHKQKPDP